MIDVLSLMNALPCTLSFLLDAALGLPDVASQLVYGEVGVGDKLADVGGQKGGSIVPEFELLQNCEVHVKTVGTGE